MASYRKKPVVIEALQHDGSDAAAQRIIEWANLPHGIHLDGSLTIPTLEGSMKASVGDWVIRGVNGEFYPCKPEIFEKTYEEVTNGPL